jgi:hypothetical protein
LRRGSFGWGDDTVRVHRHAVSLSARQDPRRPDAGHQFPLRQRTIRWASIVFVETSTVGEGMKSGGTRDRPRLFPHDIATRMSILDAGCLKLRSEPNGQSRHPAEGHGRHLVPRHGSPPEGSSHDASMCQPCLRTPVSHVPGPYTLKGGGDQTRGEQANRPPSRRKWAVFRQLQLEYGGVSLDDPRGLFPGRPPITAALYPSWTGSSPSI